MRAYRTDKKIWLPILIVFGIVALLLVLLVVGTKVLSADGSQNAPVLLAEQSHYEMYEIRSGEILLTYEITLQNNTGSDLVDFAMRGILQDDYKSGYLLDSAATVREWGTKSTVFSLKNGETKTFTLVLTASYYRNDKEASGTLPQLFAVYPDGTEGKISIR